KRFLIAGCHRVEPADRLVGEVESLSTQALGRSFARFDNQKFVHGPYCGAQRYHVFTPNLPSVADSLTRFDLHILIGVFDNLHKSSA
ncbi:MAG: hypothetical protein DMF59_13785, partial [Acidobacteria bacterium]